ncbi:MAG: hypothetical protein WKF37_00865 [Bryobacteraceae bacterium]
MKQVALLLLWAGIIFAAGRGERFALILEDPPLAQQTSGKVAHKAALLNRQASIRSALADHKMQVVGQTMCSPT